MELGLPTQLIHFIQCCVFLGMRDLGCVGPPRSRNSRGNLLVCVISAWQNQNQNQAMRKKEFQIFIVARDYIRSVEFFLLYFLLVIGGILSLRLGCDCKHHRKTYELKSWSERVSDGRPKILTLHRRPLWPFASSYCPFRIGGTLGVVSRDVKNNRWFVG